MLLLKSRSIVVINFLLIIIFFSYSIYREERGRSGEKIILELAPVDPRSLMQGDYMILDFQFERDLVREKNYPKEGYIIFDLDKDNVAHFLTTSEEFRRNSVKYKNHFKFDIGIDSYFFQEGYRKHFEQARYLRVFLQSDGSIKVDTLLDRDFNDLEKIK